MEIDYIVISRCASAILQVQDNKVDKQMSAFILTILDLQSALGFLENV